MNFLEPTITGFRDQCVDLKMIRIQILLADGIFQGTISEKNSWKLVEGWGETSEDFTVDILTPQIFHNPLEASYSGKCTDNLQVRIAWRDNPGPGFDTHSGTITNFKDIASEFVKEYSTKCANVNQISFTLDYLPDGYYCEKGSDCRMFAKKEHGWKLSQGNIKSESERVYLVRNYEEIIQYFLDKKNMDDLMDYSDYFKVFYQDFTELYGEHCTSNLTSYTTLKIYSFNKKYDSDGFEISSEQLGPPQIVNVERRYLDRYQNFSSQNKAYMLREGLISEAKSRKRGSFGGAVGYIQNRISQNNFMDNYLKKNCGNESMKQLYDRVNVFANKL